MTPSSSAERRARACLPAIRFLQAYVPFPMANRLIRLGMARVRLPADVTREALSADGVSCERLTPRDSPNDRALLYLHGGGFVFGLTPLHVEMVAHLARQMNIRALLVDYRLAPEHPFPAALDDCLTAYRWLLRQGLAARNVVVAGDSAGGNLALTSLLKLRDGGGPLPAAAACLSPVADLAGRGSPPPGFRDPLLPRKAVGLYSRSYVAEHDARDPLISPVLGDWRGLPPLLIHVGEDELLRADAVRVAELARAAGVEVRLEIYPRMWHVWQIFHGLPQTVQSLDDIARFLGGHLGALPAPA